MTRRPTGRQADGSGAALPAWAGKDDLTTYGENTWCPGCGNFAILNAAKSAVRALEAEGVSRERIVMAAGIGQHAKIFDYLGLSGVYSLHGRALATAQGMKLGNPDLKVIAFVGDGDTMGEGIAHLIFAAKRNSDITVVMHDNGVYALTTGQRSPLSPEGYKGPSTPHGNTEPPLNPLVLALEAGATYVARGYSGDIEGLAGLIVGGVRHNGFAFIDVLQPCVTFNNRYEEYNKLAKPMGSGPLPFDQALALSREHETLPTGVLFREERASAEELLTRGRNPVRDHECRDERVAAVRKLLAV
jgi:2-oxoglutarate ferredoxin oxidoreductase subunit beta